jgi:N-acetyl-gamma-glutamylphosphate reductase
MLCMLMLKCMVYKNNFGFNTAHPSSVQTIEYSDCKWLIQNVKLAVRIVISGCYQRMQMDSLLVFKENKAISNNQLVVCKFAGLHSYQILSY